MEQENKEKFELYKIDIYRAYGHFAIEFEHMCTNLRDCISNIMQAKGLEEQELCSVLLADFTANPLIEKLRTFISIYYRDYPVEIQIVEPLFKFCREINEKRNEIIHGNWFIDYAAVDQIEFDIAVGAKIKSTSKGIKVNTFEFSSNIFDQLTEKIKISSDLLSRLSSCIAFNLLPSMQLNRSKLEKLKIN